MDQQPTGKKKEIIAALVVLVVIASVATASSLGAKKKNPDTAPNTSNTQPSSSVPSEHQNTADPNNSTSTPDTTSNGTPSSYKDGTYSATGGYSSPGGFESITIGVTLQNGVVTDTTAQSGAVDSDGREYQSRFISGYKQLVVGKSIDSISLSRVAGSSLTSQGFNNALEKIKSQAKQNV